MGQIKHDLQDLVAFHYLEANQPPPRKSSQPSFTVDSPGANCLYAHIDMDCYFVQVALLSRPELRDRPCAVASSDR